MKKMMFVFAVLTSLTAQAAAPSQDASLMTRIFLNNPTLGELLKPVCGATLIDISSTEEMAGVTKYELMFTSSGRCFSRNDVKITVIENMRPTWSDGRAVYTVTATEKARQ